MVGPQPLNQSGTKGNVESPLGSTRYVTPRHGQWLRWLVRVEARRVSPAIDVLQENQCTWYNSMHMWSGGWVSKIQVVDSGL